MCFGHDYLCNASTGCEQFTYACSLNVLSGGTNGLEFTLSPYETNLAANAIVEITLALTNIGVANDPNRFGVKYPATAGWSDVDIVTTISGATFTAKRKVLTFPTSAFDGLAISAAHTSNKVYNVMKVSISNLPLTATESIEVHFPLTDGNGNAIFDETIGLSVSDPLNTASEAMHD